MPGKRGYHCKAGVRARARTADLFMFNAPKGLSSLTDNTPGLLPVRRTVACKERQYDLCQTVSFLRRTFRKVSAVSVYKGKNVRLNQEKSPLPKSVLEI